MGSRGSLRVSTPATASAGGVIVHRGGRPRLPLPSGGRDGFMCLSVSQTAAPGCLGVLGLGSVKARSVDHSLFACMCTHLISISGEVA